MIEKELQNLATQLQRLAIALEQQNQLHEEHMRKENATIFLDENEEERDNG